MFCFCEIKSYLCTSEFHDDTSWCSSALVHTTTRNLKQALIIQIIFAGGHCEIWSRSWLKYYEANLNDSDLTFTLILVIPYKDSARRCWMLDHFCILGSYFGGLYQIITSATGYNKYKSASYRNTCVHNNKKNNQKQSSKSLQNKEFGFSPDIRGCQSKI